MIGLGFLGYLDSCVRQVCPLWGAGRTEMEMAGKQKLIDGIVKDDSSIGLAKIQKHQSRRKLAPNGIGKWVFKYRVDDTAKASATSKKK